MSDLSDFCMALHLNEDFLLKFDVDELIDYAHVAVQKENWKVSEIISSRVIELDPNNEECWFVRGQAIYNQVNDSDEVISCYDKVISIGGKRLKMALWGKSLVYGMQSKFTDALAYCNKALDVDSEDILLLNLKINILFHLSKTISKSGNYQDALVCCDQALKCFDRELEINQNNKKILSEDDKLYAENTRLLIVDIWNEKGRLHELLDDDKEAHVCFSYADNFLNSLY